MRSFIALELPIDFTDELVLMSEQLKRFIPGKFVPRENYHLTLRSSAVNFLNF